ncbi:hypothetical protein K439DRAFT_1538896 [Ramaria rubella]|nr:hypothetical protein K439DRAFT_1538896 [Ramaria rubella]
MWKREDEDDYLDDGNGSQDVSKDNGTPEPKKKTSQETRTTKIPSPSTLIKTLLKKYYKRGKHNKSIKKANADDFEDEDDTEQRLLKLGGWVRCLKCCVVSHWACLR